jgi:Uncharacterized protein conserved in bacteria (DUF2334)
MRRVILRDDDTNALTPVEALERLYRPFLDRGLPVNLATIPNVRLDARTADGRPEGFLVAANGEPGPTAALRHDQNLARYLRANRGFHIVQHGFDHSLYEFERRDRIEIARRLDEGARLLVDAGFPKPQTFVAPYDRLSRTSLKLAATRFPVISTGWFEWRRLPWAWRPAYLRKKASRSPHWRVGNTVLLSHPGCLLSCFKPCDGMLENVRRAVEGRRLTVLVTHWWEYFRDNRPDEPFIAILHQVADLLAKTPNLKVITFAEAQRVAP